ncbi:hypothetical protein BpHYR1_014071 [Brachionus plicatilis]|uniref:Uncharacterized protein n=1 Tax=Brachionus plicatilis TaxID=10195 RepID=A0A3M7PL65_BRAPC|nr:hypothetical protein BpHYR1_014071 [Brachionus plicatilis]
MDILVKQSLMITKTNNQRRSNNNSNKFVNIRCYECKEIINELSQVASKEYYMIHDRIEQLLKIKQMCEEDINFSFKLITTESVVDVVLNKEVTFFNQHANEILETSSHIQDQQSIYRKNNSTRKFLNVLQQLERNQFLLKSRNQQNLSIQTTNWENFSNLFYLRLQFRIILTDATVMLSFEIELSSLCQHLAFPQNLTLILI